MKLLYYFHIGFNNDQIMMIYLEGKSKRMCLFKFYLVLFSLRSANAHTDSLGEVDVISDAEVCIQIFYTHLYTFSFK